MLRFVFGFLLLITSGVPLLAQGTDEQLAAQFFANREFDKAADAYERLVQKTPGSVYYYENLLQCYVNLGHFFEAEKLVKKQQRRFEGQAFYKVDLGYLYTKQGLPDKARNYYEGLFKNFAGTEDQTISLAHAFQKRNEWEWAVQTYLRARKKNGGHASLFALPLAQVYASLRQTGPMVEEYLNALQDNPTIQDQVQEYLQLYMEQDADYELLKSAILKRVKNDQGSMVYNELLIWLYVQRKDFTNALVQAKALDKRNREEGRRVYELANLALSNAKYDDALNAYQYILLMGKDRPLYLAARIGILESRNRKVTQSTVYTANDLVQLEKEYELFLTEEGKSNFTASAMRELAKLEIYYLSNSSRGIALFQELIAMPRLDNRFKAECKLMLGDVHVLEGEVWEAVLLYGQVDKDFLEDPLGQEAKFRNARLSYYIGEFEWAKAQLDVLKTATSQLIANDALELSLLIQDNTVDSIEEPLLMFAKADLHIYQKKHAQALVILDSINLLFPRHTLDDDILYKRAQISLQKGNYPESIEFLQRLLKEHGSGILGDNALFMLADITHNRLHDAAGAIKLYEQFINQYPGSFFLTEVRKRYRNLRGDVLNE
ncbi:MAG: tetratricopeptide repeat protein [Bacteroidia bacterium]|jgi:tetratricopeptide (TPR) repeat protein